MFSFARMRIFALLTAGVLTACRSTTGNGSGPPPAPPPQGAPTVRVQGNQLVDSAGRAVRLRGVNRSGTEYACAQGGGIFDGPSDSASVRAIRSWGANRSEEHTSELQSLAYLVCRLLLEKKKKHHISRKRRSEGL